MSEHKPNWKSRKFWAWITWGIITLVALVGSISSAWQLPVDSIIGWYGGVTMIWIGVEGANDFIGQRLSK